MQKDKKNKSGKSELKYALNSNYSYDDELGDIPFAFADEPLVEPDVVTIPKISIGDIGLDDADKHILVTAGEDIESPIEEKEEPKETSKETLDEKKMLKKNNGTAVSRMIKDKPDKKKRQTVIFGMIISVLVCVGFISTVTTVTNFTKNLANATSLKSELLNVVFPMVIVDIPEFETPTNLDSSVIISTAIWSFVTDTQKDMSKYLQDDLGSIYVPDVDIEIYVRRLYGSAIEIKHQTINDSNIQMVYNEQEKMYIIDSNPNSLPYSPRIDEVKRTGSIYNLTVSYVLPTVSWSLSSYDIEAQEADKIMEYCLQKVDDNYHLVSVRLLAINDHSTTSSNDETEYMGSYGDFMFEDSEIAPNLIPDDQIASDIMAEEAKKTEGDDSDDIEGDDTIEEEKEDDDSTDDDVIEEEEGEGDDDDADDDIDDDSDDSTDDSDSTD